MLLKTHKIFIAFLASFVVFASLAGAPQTVEAQARSKMIDQKTGDAFMRRYCANINVDLSKLQELLAALNELIAALRAGVGNVGIQITPPKLCMPDVDFGANVNIPDLSNIMQCLGSFSVQVTTPDFSNVGSCLSALIPSLDYSFNFDPSQTLSCLNNLSFSIDIPNIRRLIEAIQRLIASLADGVLAKINASFDPDFFLHVKALASMCKRAKLNARR